MIEKFGAWLDNNIGKILAVLGLAILLVVLWPQLARGQAVNQPPMSPGDVLYVDNTTQQGYLVWRADAKRFEVLAPYTQEQVFHLLLAREQAVWEMLYWYERGTVVKPPMASMPGRQK